MDNYVTVSAGLARFCEKCKEIEDTDPEKKGIMAAAHEALKELAAALKDEKRLGHLSEKLNDFKQRFEHLLPDWWRRIVSVFEEGRLKIIISSNGSVANVVRSDNSEGK